MQDGTRRAALLGIAISSLLSCGAAEDAPAVLGEVEAITSPPIAVATDADPAPSTANGGPTPPVAKPASPADTFTTRTSPAFTYTQGTALVDDGYDTPGLSTSQASYRWDGGRWVEALPTSRTRWEDSPLEPDFRALGTHAPRPNEEDWFSPSAFGSSSARDLYVFGWAGSDLGVAHWSSAAGPSFATLPSIGQYAVFPHAVIARSADDVWVAASATSDHFGKDFPGCPSILIAEQDNGVVAHFDGARWSVLPFAGDGALSAIHARDDDAVEVIAGGTFVVTTQGRWTRIDNRVKARALAAGWKVERGRVLHERAGSWEDLALALPEDREGRFVPTEAHVIDASEVWIEGEVVTGRESPPYVMPERLWLRAARL